MPITEQQQLQNCVNWNIEQRDEAKRRAFKLIMEEMPLSAQDADREARHFQRNIDALNRRINMVQL